MASRRRPGADAAYRGAARGARVGGSAAQRYSSRCNRERNRHDDASRRDGDGAVFTSCRQRGDRLGRWRARGLVDQRTYATVRHADDIAAFFR